METLPRAVDVHVPADQYVPEGFEAADAEGLRHLAQGLLDRPIESPGELARYISDWGELSAAVDDAGTRRHVASDRDTRDEAAAREFARFQREVNTPWLELDDALARRLLASPYAGGLDPALALLVRQRRETAALFRAENLPRRARDRELATRWAQIQGAVQVELEGQTLTAARCEAIDVSRDRARRAAAYAALAQRRLADRDAIDALFDELVAVRHASARCAGCEDYVRYRFRELHRIDYTPADCDAFARAVERHLVPLLRELRARRAAALDLASLSPFDLRVNPHTRDDSALFEDEPQFTELGARILARVSPELAAQFDVLRRNRLLDLFARPGKAPGGYCAPIAGLRLPFLFVNAAGTPRDLVVLLHEVGHALHTIASREREPAAYREYGSEIAEVASMSMELFGLEVLPQVLAPERARALALEQLEGVVAGLCRTAQIDSFQRWLYEHPEHTRAERQHAWIAASERFWPSVDWSGFEEVRANDWQRVPHFFVYPLYYIEYGIAQLGALQVWRNARRDPHGALEAYRRALELGGSQPLPALFETAGARFGLDEPLVAELTGELRAAIERLGAARGR